MERIVVLVGTILAFVRLERVTDGNFDALA